MFEFRSKTIFSLCIIGITAIGAAVMPTHAKESEDYRIYDENSPEHVKKFYRDNHHNQTLQFVLEKKAEYLPPKKMDLGIWDVVHLLDSIVDESDPDLDLPQSYHCFQTAEAMREDGQPRWLILTGFIHDLGKMLAYFGEPQWAVVGDTYPVGCGFSEKIVFPHFFADNPDANNPDYQTRLGIYEEGCGWANVNFSWGHDEYLYQVVKDYIPEEAAYAIRYHSFYPGHQEGEYTYLMNDYDRKMMPWLKLFQSYDLYSKEHEKLDVEEILPYYKDLVAEYFPEKIRW